MFSVVYDNKIAVASIFDDIPRPWSVIDCRPLIDGPGNSNQLVENILQSGMDKLLDGQKVCFACDYGHSRSNYLAALAICRIDRTSIDTAVKTIKANHPESSVKPDLFRSAKAKKKSILNRNRIAITGAHTNLGQLLAKKIELISHKPLLLDEAKQSDYITIPPRYQHLLVSNQITDVFHCTYPSPPNSYASSKKSYSQLLDIAEACIATDSTLHYLSSWSIFEGTIDNEVDESSLPQPFSLHSQARCLHEQQLRYLGYTCELRYKIYRMPCLLSKSNHLPRFLAYLADTAAAGRDIYLHKCTNGYPVVPLMSEDEALSIISNTILTKENIGAVVHICGNTSNESVISIGKRIAKAYNINIIETHVNRNALTGSFVSKYSLASSGNCTKTATNSFDPIQYVEEYIHTKQLAK